MRRREFITLLGGAAAAWPLAASAQQTMPMIGFLNRETGDLIPRLVAAWPQRDRLSGNVAIEHRWAEAHYERLPQVAAELVNLKGRSRRRGLPAARRAQAATSKGTWSGGSAERRVASRIFREHEQRKLTRSVLGQ